MNTFKFWRLTTDREKKKNLKSLGEAPAASEIANDALELKGIDFPALGNPLIEHLDDVVVPPNGADSGKQISTPRRREFGRNFDGSSCRNVEGGRFPKSDRIPGS